MQKVRAITRAIANIAILAVCGIIVYLYSPNSPRMVEPSFIGVAK